MFTRRDLLRGGALASAAPLSLGALHAQSDYPSGPIRAISMFAPGSGADTKIRYYANKLAEKTGKSVIVENKIGAMGNIATEFVARAKPDGHTIYIAPGSSMLAAAPQLFKKLSYDPINDFEHITTLNFSAFALCVAGNSPFHSVGDLVAHLKEKGEDAFYASNAPPSVVSAEIFKRKFGLKTNEVKYRTQNNLFPDMFEGRLAFTWLDFISVAAHRKAGRIRLLCMACADRLQSAPDVPGSKESGIDGLDIRNWWSVHVPAKTPKPVCDRLETLFNEISNEPDTLKWLDINGSDPLPGNSKMLRELLIKETENWAGYAKLANLDPG